MTWLEIALIGAVLVGATAGTVLIVRSPNFWFGLVAAAVKAALPFILTRMKPGQEAQWRDATRKGDAGDEFMRRKQGLPPKG